MDEGARGRCQQLDPRPTRSMDPRKTQSTRSGRRANKTHATRPAVHFRRRPGSSSGSSSSHSSSPAPGSHWARHSPSSEPAWSPSCSCQRSSSPLPTCLPLPRSDRCSTCRACSPSVGRRRPLRSCGRPRTRASTAKERTQGDLHHSMVRLRSCGRRQSSSRHGRRTSVGGRGTPLVSRRAEEGRERWARKR